MIGDAPARPQPSLRVIAVVCSIAVVLGVAVLVHLTRSDSIVVSSGTSSLILRHDDSRLTWVLAGQPLPSSGSIYVPAGHAAGLALNDGLHIRLAGDTLLSYEAEAAIFSLHVGAASFDTGRTTRRVRIPGGAFVLDGRVLVQVSPPEPLHPGTTLQIDLVVEKGTVQLEAESARGPAGPRTFRQDTARRFRGSLHESTTLTSAGKARLGRRVTHSGQNGRLERRSGETVEQTLARTVRHQAMPAAVDAVKAVVRLNVETLHPILVSTLHESREHSLPVALSTILKQALAHDPSVEVRTPVHSGQPTGDTTETHRATPDRPDGMIPRNNEPPAKSDDRGPGRAEPSRPRPPQQGESPRADESGEDPPPDHGLPAESRGATASTASPGTGHGETDLSRLLVRLQTIGDRAVTTRDRESIRLLGYEMVHNSSSTVRFRAANLLLNVKTPLSAPDFHKILDQPDEPKLVCLGLTYFRTANLPDPLDPAVEARIRELARQANPDSVVRMLAIRALVARVGAKAAPLLRDLLLDAGTPADVQAEAVEALIKVGNRNIAGLLRRHYDAFRDRPAVAAAIVKAYGRLTEKAVSASGTIDRAPRAWLIERLRDPDHLIKQNACQALARHRKDRAPFVGRNLRELQTILLEPRPDQDEAVTLRGFLAFHVFQDLPAEERAGFLDRFISAPGKPAELLGLLRALELASKAGRSENAPELTDPSISLLIPRLVDHEDWRVSYKALRILDQLGIYNARLTADGRTRLDEFLKNDPEARKRNTWLMMQLHFQATGDPDLLSRIRTVVTTSSNTERISGGLASLFKVLGDRAVPMLLEQRPGMPDGNRLYLANALLIHGIPERDRSAVHQWWLEEKDPAAALLLSMAVKDSSRSLALQALDRYGETIPTHQQDILTRQLGLASFRELRARILHSTPLPRTLVEKLARHVVQTSGR